MKMTIPNIKNPKRFNPLGWVLLAAMLLAGCAGQYEWVPAPTYAPRPLPADAYAAKVDRFEIVLDASASMNHDYLGANKYRTAQDLVARMIRTLPDVPMKGALRSFGHGDCMPPEINILHEPLSPLNRVSMLSALEALYCSGGNSRLDLALEGAAQDLMPAGGRPAVIVVSDGREMGTEPLAAAQKLAEALGPDTCIHTIQIGDDAAGERLFEQMSTLTPCGIAVNAEGVMSQRDMNAFVEAVFLSKAKDSDGDGVPDDRDKCPDTPKGIPVDTDGCPLDSDGDGVPDDRDKCPDTPRGARVNEQGCWVLKNVHFDWDKWDIKPEFKDELANVVDILSREPEMRVEIQGHTDSTGTRAHNQKLSEMRAKSVQNYLVRQGIPMRRLTTVGYGQSRPVDTNATEKGRAANRRVEFKPIR